ncbi:MAG TPA: SIMPL domain-containing protein [Methylocystis sp.]|nr:SIMPL domain-containing protein [Methylocystis sp.]
MAANNALAGETDSRCGVPHITVRGEAKSEEPPNVAYLSFGVVNDAPTAEQAAADNAAPSAATIEAVKAMGVDSKDIQSLSFSVSPVYLEERDPATRQPIKQKITGYRANHLFRLRLHDVDKVGFVVAKLLAKGANEAQNFSFGVTDQDNKMDALRFRAVAEARRRAEVYAKAASMKLGRLLALDPQPGETGYADLPMRRFEAKAVIPVEPGVIQLTTEVEATWELIP